MRIYKVVCIVGRIAIVRQRAVSCTSFPSHCHLPIQTRKGVHRESPYMYDTVQAVSLNSVCTSAMKTFVQSYTKEALEGGSQYPISL